MKRQNCKRTYLRLYIFRILRQFVCDALTGATGRGMLFQVIAAVRWGVASRRKIIMID